MFKALSVPSFRWLWTGQLLSQFGNAVFLVMGLWEIQLKDPVLLSVAGLAMMLPQVLAAVGGVLVDRWDTGQIMLWTDVMRGATVVLGLLLLLSRPEWQPWIIIALLGTNSLGNALFNPAENVILPLLVESADLPSANGLYSITFQLSSAIGSGIGGAAIAAAGVTVIFGFDMGSFWFSALSILLMMRRTMGPNASTRQTHREASPRLGFREGWQVVSQMRWFMVLLPVVVLANFAYGGGFILLPYWMHHHLGVTAGWYGITDGSWAMGMVLGGLSAGLLSRYALGRTVSILGLVQALMMGIFAGAHSAPLASLVLLIAGYGNGAVNTLMLAWMQQVIPEAVRGRAFGLLITLLTLANPVAALLAGLSLGVVPTFWWYALCAISGVAVGLAIWWLVPKNKSSSLTEMAGDEFL